MTVYIITDLEGASGVDRFEMIGEEGTEGHRNAKRRLTADLNAAIAGCFDGGADKVWVLDGHGSGGLVHEDVEVARGLGGPAPPPARGPGSGWPPAAASGRPKKAAAPNA